jgi:murein DD-endopeptidase MepM/ murein hydrolase activator NlpD
VSYTYPLGRKGAIIGTPYHGTHTLGNWQSDNALDIKVPEGTPVYAVTDGTIGPRIGSFNTKNPRFAGERVTVVGKTNSFYYAHLSKLVVQAGQTVTAGQLLGYSGEANGVAHLHFAVKAGAPGDVVRGAPTAAPAAQAEPQAPAAAAAPVAGDVPTVTPPASQGVPLPGSENHVLPGTQYTDTWQAVAQLPDLHPDTQRFIQLAGGMSA